MPKIGTALVEIKPVLNEEALAQIAALIEAAVKAGVEAGMAAARPPVGVTFTASQTEQIGAWNGPICPTCGTRYLGNHTCTVSTS